MSSLRRRRATGKLAQAACWAALIVGLAPLVALLFYTIKLGAPGLSLGFLTHAPTPEGVPGGGISTAIVGTARIVAVALLCAVPVGLLAALYLHERPGRIAGALRFSAGVAAGVPSIVLGIFAYALLVRPLHHFSDLAASFALAVLMLPIMIRANEEAMRALPLDLWEAGIALGARRSSVARRVLLRGALPGVVGGNLLAVARAVGETAPLLFTLAAPTAAMTLLILNDGSQAYPAAIQTAWATALVLLFGVLVLNAAARTISWALTRRTR